jgi:hypothetical protein
LGPSSLRSSRCLPTPAESEPQVEGVRVYASHRGVASAVRWCCSVLVKLGGDPALFWEPEKEPR